MRSQTEEGRHPVRKVPAAGKRKEEGKQTNTKQPLISCGCGRIPAVSAGTEPRQSHKDLSSVIAPPSSIFNR